MDRLSQSATSYDTDRLGKTYALARSMYGDSKHWTGETILSHTLGILEELAPFEPDEDTVIACLLHHVLEQKTMTLVELEQQFGPKVRSLISGIHLISHVTLEGRRRSIEDLRLILLSVSDDIRIVLVSLCDRAHCLKFVSQADPARAKRLCQDVLQLFAPVAARLGIYSLKHKLENGAFPVLYPDDSSRIEEQVTSIHTSQPSVLEEAKASLDTFLTDQGITAQVDAREKQPFSIFQKMDRKSITHIESVHDLFALRVVVATEEDCYRVLGLLHQLGRPLPNRFKDYIAFPKPNGYQSLHTTLAGFADLPDTTFVEVQIRTVQMHREALYGVAAHWSYKAHGATEQAMENVQLHSMLVGQESVNKEEEDLSYADHIFVLTPRGDIVELPEGATPLDFAFQVHTDLGLSFRNSRVNGSIVPLDYELENGDVVEITKHSQPRPSPHWMQMLKMGSSRGKLRRYLYAQDRPNLVATGKTLVNAELKKRNLPELRTDLSVLRVCDGEVLNTEQREDLLMKIGQGSERASYLFARLAAFAS
ncbi:MAG: HD domain-containing protein, partial [Candidatus Peribacteraceae bacterium]|nr:HD domain-containing protein [Candidatus Peribacteraceae bacterium]